jgi:ATP synthase protein I
MDNKRDDSFAKRLSEARARQGLDKPEHGAEEAPPQSAAGQAARAGVELVSALLVAVGIGYWLDRWLHTRPVFLLIFFFMGGAAGILNVWRLTAPRKGGPDRNGTA